MEVTSNLFSRHSPFSGHFRIYPNKKQPKGLMELYMCTYISNFKLIFVVKLLQGGPRMQL